MCGIAGFCNFQEDFLTQKHRWQQVLVDMREEIAHRGPDQSGKYLRENVGLSHARLSIRDLSGGVQPMVRRAGGAEYGIVYNGEVYNTRELTADLAARGYQMETTSDTEVILCAYMAYGPSFVTRLNGIFAFAIWDGARQTLRLYRDRLGVKPHKAFLRVTKSNLPGSASYKANLVNRETVGMEELAARAVARSCSYSQETLIAAYRILKEELYDALRRGLNVDFEFGRIEMGVSGAFRSALDPFDPERNQLVANLRPSPRLRQLAASIPAENMTTDFFPNSPQPAYVSLRIEPRTAESDEPYNQLPAGTHKHVSVYGRRLRLMGDALPRKRRGALLPRSRHPRQHLFAPLLRPRLPAHSRRMGIDSMQPI